ncbi:MAG: radical SAM protein [Syntrophaceae bacterium]|nr:radical SAM protein [Syntrophaceae bacterium]MBP9650990.1 radical SAM protein [Syntrophaceae bacterium]HOU57103.1 radical SAM protein [Smithellaceae bacterium]HQG99749.1 radical SAM protein [Smithellaceae bacterium]HQJ78189.1 radical SAM protein [Smithellaceae bacterium]
MKQKKVNAFYRPPSLLFRQLGSALLMGYLTGWRSFPGWLLRHGFSSMPVANGARGMGCIGYPGHPVWEVTGACNLRCIHCHATSGQAAADELSTDEGKKLIDQLAAESEFRTLIYTGGEPLVRPDIFELLRHSQKAGLANIIATNGTLIDEEMAFKLKDHGVVCNAISFDAANPSIHDMVRNKAGSFDLAMRAVVATKKAGILLQINTTAMEYNMPYLPELIDFADSSGAGILLMYQLVAVGRGEKIEKATLKKTANKYLSELISLKQKTAKTIIEPVAGPQYWPFLLEKGGIRGGLPLKLAGQVFHGCSAGRGFVYVKANGDVWPCPFVEVSGGNIRGKSFHDIYTGSTLFNDLRRREEKLKGLCGECPYKTVCGGCRGRAHAYSGDPLAEDPRCFIRERSRPAEKGLGKTIKTCSSEHPDIEAAYRDTRRRPATNPGRMRALPDEQ